MDILVSVNRAYLTPLNVMLHSLFINNPQSNINIHVLHSGLTGEDINTLFETVNKYGGSLTPYLLKDEYRRISDITEEFPPEAFYRLFCMDYLPRSVKRVLYLDSDIIINGPLEILFNLDMAGNIIAAATDSHNHTQEVTRIKRELGLPQDFEYVNSGVLVMDIEAMRGYITTAEIINRLTVYRSRLKYPDQDLLNVLFNDKILHLDRYMYNYSPFSNCSWLDDLTAGYPAVIHFTGIKPWKPAYPTHNSFLRKAKALYEFYASLCSKRFNEKKLAE